MYIIIACVCTRLCACTFTAQTALVLTSQLYIVNVNRILFQFYSKFLLNFFDENVGKNYFISSHFGEGIMTMRLRRISEFFSYRSRQKYSYLHIQCVSTVHWSSYKIVWKCEPEARSIIHRLNIKSVNKNKARKNKKQDRHTD